MAWNQSSCNNKCMPSQSGGLRGLITIIIVTAILVISGIVFVVMRQGSHIEDTTANNTFRRPRISEVKPATNTTARVENLDSVAPDNKTDPNARPTKPGQKLNGYVMLPNGELHKIRGEVYSNANRKKPKYAVFKYPAENIIAGILAVRPGSMVVGKARDYKGKFIESFNKSLFEPIIVNDDDSEYEKEIKRSVAEAKKELKAAMDRGEDIEEIIKESRNELQRLASYKSDIRSEVLKYLNKEAANVEDAEDMFMAANKILEAKGIAPLSDVPLVKIKLKMAKDMDM